MTSAWMLIAEDEEDLETLEPSCRIAVAADYVTRPHAFQRDAKKIINLARSYGYQSTGYYASLLAEARGHRVVPTVETILDLASRSGYAHALPELETALNRDLARQPSDPRPRSLLVCFGKADPPLATGFARMLFDWFRAPAIGVSLKTTQGNAGPWTRITKLHLKPLKSLTRQQKAFFAQTLQAHTKRAWRDARERVPPRFAIAVLYDPQEALPPSTPDTLRYWARVAARQGVEVEPIGRRELARLSEFDALFIRETTSIRNHTYRFAQRARIEGMPVIDDPISMIRCTNKVYLWERLSQAGLPTPPTELLRPGDDLAGLADRLGYPVVVKIPDGSFSRGVRKAASMAELAALTQTFFAEADLLLAQKFTPTRFDWRIGVLGNAPLFACRYTMARGHWQIVNHKADGRAVQGAAQAVALAEAPPEIIDLAVRGAMLIGDGLYGVDVKETEAGPVIIEINDNPNLEHGYEDGKGGVEIWTRLTRWFRDRLTS